MNESCENTITYGFRELPSVAGSLLKAAIGVLKYPDLAAASVRAAITGNWDSKEFMKPTMVNVISRMYTERSETVKSFQPGEKIIIVNHTSLPAILAAVARRMPKGEKMPYIFSDILSPYKIYTSCAALLVQRFVALRLMQLELTLPFILAAISESNDDLVNKIFQTANVQGKIYKSRELLRKIREIQQEDPHASFLVFIEARPSRGESLNPTNPNLVHLTNFLRRTFPKTQLYFLAFNTETQKASSFRIRREDTLAKGRKRKLPEGNYYRQNLKRALSQT